MSCPFGHGSPSSDASVSHQGQTDAANETQEENPLIAGTYYGEYLQLDKILTAQKMLSEEKGIDAHDEMLFIITHQAYELWFKQILFEVDSVIEIMARPVVPERDTATVAHRLNRVTEIQKILIDQIRVLETMLPLDFLDFRKVLSPASGFQSVQFRLFENRLGMDPNRRLNYMSDSYTRFFRNADQKELVKSHSHLSLLQVVESWLERTPFVQIEGFDFWSMYQQIVTNNLNEEKALIESLAAHQDPEAIAQQLKSWEKNKNSFDEIFDEEKYNESKERGQRRLSWKAMKAVLFINLFREEPVLHIPFNILRLLVDIDELLTTWRYRHAMMVQRMIGMKIGTGGSSGYHYLKATVSDRYKVFVDLFTVSALLVPRSQRPVLPQQVQDLLGFSFSNRSPHSSSSSSSSAPSE